MSIKDKIDQNGSDNPIKGDRVGVISFPRKGFIGDAGELFRSFLSDKDFLLPVDNEGGVGQILDDVEYLFVIRGDVSFDGGFLPPG